MSSIDELRTLKDKLQDYFDKLSLNLSNTSNPLPSFEDYIAFLTYDALLTDAISGSDRAASYSNGALTDTAHMVAAISREFAMRTKSKASYFTDGEDDSSRVSTFMDTMFGRYYNYIRGTSPEQSRE